MNELMRKILFLPEQASSFSARIDQLHYFVITTTMIASALITLAALGFYVRYRWRGAGGRGQPVHSHWWTEAAIIGGPLVFFLLWFVIGYRDYVVMKSPPPDSMDVYVMGKQWMWKFAYPEGPNGVNVLRVPVNRPVRLLITSRDVLHSFYVPSFRIKQDALPGRYTESWFEATQTGRFQVLCAEYCGTGHSTMRAEVVVLPQDEFDRWMLEQKQGRALARDGSKTGLEDRPVQATMAEMGRQLAISAGCVKCHSVNGEAHIGPTWLDMYHRREKLSDGSTVLVDEEYITESMMEPARKQVAGFQLVMPTFKGRLEAPEVSALVEYIKTLRSDRPQPEPDHPAIYQLEKGINPDAVPNPYAGTGAAPPANAPVPPPAPTTTPASDTAAGGKQ